MFSLQRHAPSTPVLTALPIPPPLEKQCKAVGVIGDL